MTGAMMRVMTSAMTGSLTPLAGLHFLVHPFYDASLGTYERLLTEAEFNERGRPDGYLYVSEADAEDDIARYSALSRAYTERANAMKDGEILAAFLPQEEGALAFLDRRFERMYLNFLVHLQVRLGPRLFLFYRETDPATDRDIGRIVGEALARRGLAVHPETPSFAFGETLEECIPQSVRNLRRGLGLRKFTRVHPLFTDMRFEWPGLSRETQEERRSELRRYGIVLEGC
jgi:hypothetical protein